MSAISDTTMLDEIRFAAAQLPEFTVCSLDNKLDELRARLLTQRETRACCALLFTETQLTTNLLDSALQLEKQSVHRGTQQ